MSRGIVLLLLVLGQVASDARPHTAHSKRITSRLIVAPSSSKLAGGTAKLVVGVLSREGATYVGDYRIRVFPFFFKNEKGRLSIQVTEPALHRVVGGHATNFAGHAITNRSGLTRRITARATPAGKDHGALTFTVATENGPLVFNTSYRIAPD